MLRTPNRVYCSYSDSASGGTERTVTYILLMLHPPKTNEPRTQEVNNQRKEGHNIDQL